MTSHHPLWNAGVRLALGTATLFSAAQLYACAKPVDPHIKFDDLRSVGQVEQYAEALHDPTAEVRTANNGKYVLSSYRKLETATDTERLDFSLLDGRRLQVRPRRFEGKDELIDQRTDLSEVTLLSSLNRRSLYKSLDAVDSAGCFHIRRTRQLKNDSGDLNFDIQGFVTPSVYLTFDETTNNWQGAHFNGHSLAFSSSEAMEGMECGTSYPRRSPRINNIQFATKTRKVPYREELSDRSRRSDVADRASSHTDRELERTYVVTSPLGASVRVIQVSEDNRAGVMQERIRMNRHRFEVTEATYVWVDDTMYDLPPPPPAPAPVVADPVDEHPAIPAAAPALAPATPAAPAAQPVHAAKPVIPAAQTPKKSKGAPKQAVPVKK